MVTQKYKGFLFEDSKFRGQHLNRLKYRTSAPSGIQTRVPEVEGEARHHYTMYMYTNLTAHSNTLTNSVAVVSTSDTTHTFWPLARMSHV